MAVRITDIRTQIVDCFRTNWVFVFVETDAGLTGVGEGTLEYKEQALAGAVAHVRAALVGQDPFTIEKHRHDLYRDAYWRGGPVLMSAVSAVDMALWDLLGQSLGVPVYQLLGGKCRDRVRIYVNGWFAGARTSGEFAAKAKETADRGITAMKWDPFGKAYLDLTPRELNQALSCVAAVRDAVGDEVDLLIEGHGRFNVPTAIRIARELAAFKPLFFEEPVPPDNLEALAEVRAQSPVAIAAGERLYTRQDFYRLIELKAADYLQPDISHAGGLTELKKIAAMADTACLPFAPHNPSGPVANAATLQLAACVPQFSLLEIMVSDVVWRREICDEQLQLQDGYLLIPDKPGLGIRVDEAACARHPYQPHSLRHYTGALTDIRPPETRAFF
ncbi:MAG: galactonate dehydratase [Clostridiales bacterium]|nr:galactonate dehydratase [Clostridiales bacterium]